MVVMEAAVVGGMVEAEAPVTEVGDKRVVR
jgi:hypothetical protein